MIITQEHIEQAARVCHGAIKAYCETIGDYSQQSWDMAEQWQRDSAIKGVKYFLDNPTACPCAQHKAWMRDKLNNGWSYGSAKNTETKTHPNLVPYEQLPREQRIKDVLFQNVVQAFF